MTHEIRVRFAPSPTGYLHLGGARTALFNWLFARNKGGRFILRIEDTDQERSTEDSYRGLVDALAWLGLDWDEGPEVGGAYGPYFQSERRHFYNEWVQRLLSEGKAYRCFCSQETLAQTREERKEAGHATMYDRRCRDLQPADIERMLSLDRPHVIRLKSPLEGQTSFEDVIHGRLSFDNSNLEDFVVIKSDGFPTYNFAATVDDSLMKITHIIRGDDHISNTPKQIVLYEAFGIDPPHFAHVPLIMGPDKARLSKRHGATSVAQFRQDGYLPEALVNYLALLGWAYDDTAQIFSRDDLVSKFSLDRVGSTAAIFDYEKLQWMNGEYMKKKSMDEKADMVIPYLEKEGLISSPVEEELRAYTKRVVEVVGDRLKMAKQIGDLAGFFFMGEIEYDRDAAEKLLKRHYVGAAFRILEERLKALEEFDVAGIETVLRSLASEMGLKARDLFQPVRVALTGSRFSPGLFESMELLGRERVLERLLKARRTFFS
jgi:glutamyl-tRNA synthetase